MKKLFIALIIGALPFVFASCNSANSGGTSQNGQTAAIRNAVGEATSRVNTTNAPTAQASHSIYPVNVTVPCDDGGSTTVSGSMQGTSTGTLPDDTVTLTYSYTLMFNQCVSSGDDGNNYVLSGTGITVMGSSNWQNSGSGQDFVFYGKDDFSMSGNIEVSGNESMTCDIDLTQTTTTSESSGNYSETGSYSGSVCGQLENGPISISGTISPLKQIAG